MFGVFRVKNHDFTPKYHIFSNFRGHAPGASPWIRHLVCTLTVESRKLGRGAQLGAIGPISLGPPCFNPFKYLKK